MSSRESRTGIDRRQFLRQGAVAGCGLLSLAASTPSWAETAEAPRIKRRVRLGRTGLEISDIGFGSSKLTDPALIRHAFERGVRYFDTADSYRHGAAERAIAEGLAGKRDQVVIGSKQKTGSEEKRQSMMRTLEGSLKRLRTDYIDLYYSHAVNDPARLQNPEWGEFVARAKEQGKIRFVGVSGHGARLVESLDYALDHDMIDVMLVAYNFGQDPGFLDRFGRDLDLIRLQPELPRVLAKAHEKDVGVIAMKTLRGARLNDIRHLESQSATYAQAAFRWVLSDPHVNALIVTMSTTEEIDEYLVASGWQRPKRADLALLAAYEERNGASQCRYGCQICADACPAQVPIPEVLRTRMYLHDYADRELAADAYAQLGRGAQACLSCSAKPCAGACPFGIPIAELTTPVHGSLAKCSG